jgi:aquaporin NIP
MTLETRKYFAEFVGTYALVFAGTAAIVVNDLTGVVSHVGVALVFGLIVAAMIYTLGDVSGAHLNPAVTFGFCYARRLPWSELAPYISSQIAGALAASVSVRLLFPGPPHLGGTLPAGASSQAFFLEVIFTFFLMLTIISVSSGAKEKGLMAGVAIGAVIALEALVGGPISGASMNPARSLAPAVVSWQLQKLWIYMVAPPAGAALAIVACRRLRERGCCD